MKLITSDLLLACLGLFLPPFPVIIKRGLFSADFLINIALSILGGIPGVAHCWYVILKYPDDGIPFFDTRRHSYRLVPEADERQEEARSGQYTGEYTAPPPQPQASSSNNQQQPQPPSYGTVPVVPGDNKVQYP